MKYLLLVYLARVMVYCQNVRRKRGGGGVGKVFQK